MTVALSAPARIVRDRDARAAAGRALARRVAVGDSPSRRCPRRRPRVGGR
ncbi:hypothetical protein ABZX40_33915 [Streptomyces sp. NPDC004610]